MPVPSWMQSWSAGPPTVWRCCSTPRLKQSRRRRGCFDGLAATPPLAVAQMPLGGSQRGAQPAHRCFDAAGRAARCLLMAGPCASEQAPRALRWPLLLRSPRRAAPTRRLSRGPSTCGPPGRCSSLPSTPRPLVVRPARHRGRGPVALPRRVGEQQSHRRRRRRCRDCSDAAAPSRLVKVDDLGSVCPRC